MNGCPGELTERIVIQQHTTVADGLGGQTATLANISTDPNPWAKVIVMRGKENQNAERTSAFVGYQFRILNRNDITEDMVILWNSRKFNIRAVLYRGALDDFLHIETDLGVAI